MTVGDRYARQRQLVEVGDAGQSCLECSTLHVSSVAFENRSPTNLSSAHIPPEKFSEAIAEVYARAMGMKVADLESRPLLQPQPGLSESFSHFFRHTASRHIGEGAASALASALISLNVTVPPSHEV